MNAARLVKRDLLDPRPESEARLCPIGGAVNIPFPELARRLHELPPKSAPVQVAGPPELASTVVTWLEQHGRSAIRAAAQTAATAIAPPHTLQASAAGEVGRLWQPSAFLEETAVLLRPGSALDLACGSGRNAVFLAACGWSVTAVDVLPDALTLGQDLERHYAGGWQPVTWLCADLEADWPGPAARYDLITMFRYLDRPLLQRLTTWLNPGGSIVLETFTTLHRQRHSRPARPAHVLHPDELKALLEPLAGCLRLRHYSEAWRGTEHTARLWAEYRAGAMPD